jgi:hypothetical protein
MNEADLKIKQQIVDKIKNSTNILVTVSKDPSVDELSAALGLATLLNKIDKHATAIFSGLIPPAITFLNPDNVFENSADSLRDFIIALDKEKADHLRYKVEGDVVKIFITPYRTTISDDDLEFSQGDYNVELVLALGVDDQGHLDDALSAHGKILNDVTVATFSAGDKSSQLGSLDWHDEGASSLSEMVANIADSLKVDKTLFDKQIATALLTGIVAATDRFSNTRTSAKVMTLAADLMAAGADQQLIAAKLQESHEINTMPVNPNDDTATSTVPEETEKPVEDQEQSTLPPSGSLTIAHDLEPETEQSVESTIAPVDTTASVDTTLSDTLASPQPEPIDYSGSTIAPAYVLDEPAMATTSTMPDATVEPLLGGVLNATADQAADDARKELEEQQNKTILTHSYLGNPETTITPVAPINSIGQPEDIQNVDIFANAPMSTGEPMVDLPLPPAPPQLPTDFSTLPPPPLPDFNVPASIPDLSQPTVPVANDDPSQFRIPGQ